MEPNCSTLSILETKFFWSSIIKKKKKKKKGWNTEGKVLEKLSSPRSYTVETSGGVVRWNRRHILLPDTPSIPDTSSSPVDPGLDLEPTPELDTHPEPETKTRSGRVVRPPARY